jgi:cyclic beta-1,2-glucan synthetase
MEEAGVMQVESGPDKAGSPPSPVEPPVRSVLFGEARFAQHGHSLAQTHEIIEGSVRGSPFFPRLEENVDVLRTACLRLQRYAEEGYYLGPAAHWFLDNAALIEEQLSTIRHDLPRGFFRRLPRLRDEPLAGLPRVYGVAWAWVAHTDSGMDAGLLEAYLGAYQEVRPLKLAELWALPTTLRVVLIENLRRLAERTVVQQDARDAARRWFDFGPEQRSCASLDALLAPVAGLGAGEAFLLQVEQQAEELPEPEHAQIHEWLKRHLPEPEQALVRQQHEATEDQQSVRNAILTLRRIGAQDWRTVFTRTNPAMRRLASLPTFAAEDEETQADSLRRVEKFARKAHCSEEQVAEALHAFMSEVPDTSDARAAAGYWLADEGEARLRSALGIPARTLPRRGSNGARALASVAYLGAIALLSVCATNWIGHRADMSLAPWLPVLAGFLLIWPISEAVVALMNRLIAESVPPHRLPRFAFEQGIPDEAQVLVAVPAMLTGHSTVEALARKLEQHYLANPEARAQFALLSDWPDAPELSMPADEALLDAAHRAVETLNDRYPVEPGHPLRFLLLHRAREWSVTENAYIGWERKRGKLEQLVRMLAEPACAPFVELGTLSRPRVGTRYVVTLDADTDMPPGRLRALVGIAAHPLNRPVVDPVSRRVLRGYGILQPRVVTPLPASGQDTPYRWLFAGECGVDPYSATSSEIYQDCFGEGTFTGKGLFDVRAAHATLTGRLPDGQVLSHDLLEGSLARCAVVSDVALFEDPPAHPDVAASRIHRWTRGDWQLLPFLFDGRRYACAAINRWKMIDNLRRSLVIPACVLLLLLAIATRVLPMSWATAAVAAAFCAGPLLGAIAGSAPRRDDGALPIFYRHVLANLARGLMLGAWHLAQLLELALMYVDAIARAMHRQLISRRHLLQWTTSAAAQASARHDFAGLVRKHRRTMFAALAVLFATAAVSQPNPAARTLVFFVLLWCASPLWIWLASRRIPAHREPPLSGDDKAWLNGIARDTWRLYEQHVTDADNQLPPDNVQQTPYLAVAHRTSPTNIGLYLFATTAACALGFIGRVEMAERLAATLATLERLPRLRGHFYNWYDTQSLAVLHPAYVSSVDSGNCVAHMLVVAQICEALASGATSPLPADTALRRSARLLYDFLPWLDARADAQNLAEFAAATFAWPTSAGATDETITHLDAAEREFDALRTSGIAVPEGLCERIEEHFACARSQLADLHVSPVDMVAALKGIAMRLRKLALEADFGLLYDPQRRLLHIGYRAESGELDDNHYDLLASEARLTSLIAIAKGDIPPQHWGRLGRPFFAQGLDVVLKSWSGSMFEYLMPSLVLEEPEGSVLGQATRGAVVAQKLEAEGRDTPWGISESAIAVRDHTLAFQYGPQGVARLALRRTPRDERVLAPYATALALLVAPQSAVANLRALEAIGARKQYGFIESLDYTPQRQAAGSRFVEVNTFMAHHQAMVLLSIAHVLTAGGLRRLAMDSPHLRAVAPLLHESLPRELPPLHDPAPLPMPRRTRAALMVCDTEPLAEALPPTQLLTNGRYALYLRDNGAGYASWDGLALTRWRDDLPRDAFGVFHYVERADARDMHSLTAHPAPDPELHYRCRLQPDRTIFDAVGETFESSVTVWISPEDDCELRQVELRNTSRQEIELTLTQYAEITLAPLAADQAHPAFSNLFVKAAWDEATQALHFHRQPRLADEAGVCAVHFLAFADGEIDKVEPCVDRARWLGRYGTPSAPRGIGGARTLPDSATPGLPGVALDTGLDPVAVLRLKMRIAPGTTRKIVFGAAAAREGEVLAALVDKYRQPNHVLRASNMSHTMAAIRYGELGFDAESWNALLRLNTLLGAQMPRDVPLGPRFHAGELPYCDRRALWQYGISGDRPIIFVGISDESGFPFVQQLKKALRLWTPAAMPVDLVVLNAEPPSYHAPVQHLLDQLRERHAAQQDERVPQHLRATLHVLREHELAPEARQTLNMLARVRFQADARSLAQQLERFQEELQRAAAARKGIKRWQVKPVLPGVRRGREADVPGHEFDEAQGDFRFTLDAATHPSRPWVQILANPRFGCMVSEVGGGYTWAENSRMFQLTPWSNDPLIDPPGEWLFLHDVDRARVWPLGRQLFEDAPRSVTHGIGFTRMEQRVAGLDVTLTWCVDPETSVKQLSIMLRNGNDEKRWLRIVALAEWQLGSARSERLSVVTGVERLGFGRAEDGLVARTSAIAVTASQTDALGGFAGATAFLALRSESTQPQEDDWTCNRREFFDAAGRMVVPERLGRRSGAGLDACGAVGITVAAAPGATIDATLLLGYAATPELARRHLAEVVESDPVERLARQQAQWPALTGGTRVRTPDARFDALVNHWLPYQTVVCRLWARAAFYQAGGAFGFRDQLQDAMALVTRAPQLLASQIGLCAARQFPEGDVQHWWHEPGGAGVRTHFSDDLLWLPYAVALYVARTGDAMLLDDSVPFLAGSKVPDGAEDIYETPQPGPESASIYEHAARTIDHSLARGEHGLPLFGTGDWNDGMNRVGHEGRGETVWLAWFLCEVVERFAPIALERGDGARVKRWRIARRAWIKALESHGWDGAWYRRGFFDDGSPLGTAANPECRIDLIAQAWAVIAGTGDPARARQAMDSANRMLVDREHTLVKLLTPPLQRARPSAGYIQAYPPGVRENGGQYNHGAVWSLMAFAKLGRRAEAWMVFEALSPAHRWREAKMGAVYAVEPYVMAGDVYTEAPWIGRGGWSWYTGSAGWLLHAAVESLCGVVLARGKVSLQPCLPPDWPQAEVQVRHGSHEHRFLIVTQAALADAAATHPGARRAGPGETVDLEGLDVPTTWIVNADGPPRKEAPQAVSSDAAR